MILTKLTHKIIKSKINEKLEKNQFDFKRNREAIIKMIIEEVNRVNKLLRHCI